MISSREADDLISIVRLTLQLLTLVAAGIGGAFAVLSKRSSERNTAKLERLHKRIGDVADQVAAVDKSQVAQAADAAMTGQVAALVLGAAVAAAVTAPNTEKAAS